MGRMQENGERRGKDRSAMIEWRSRLDGPNGHILLLGLGGRDK